MPPTRTCCSASLRRGASSRAVPTTILGDCYWVDFSDMTRFEMEALVVRCLLSGCPDAGVRVPGFAAPAPVPVAFVGCVQVLVAATVALSAGVPIVEFGCTAGFPVLWATLLNQQQTSGTEFLGLLLLYMLIYPLDGLAFSLVAVLTPR
jgi:hypothetical protein